MSSVYTKAASRYVFNDNMATTYAVDGGKGLVGAYQNRGLAGPSDSLFVTGGGQESTMAYGFRASDAQYWNARIYGGGWLALRYYSTAKAISVVSSPASR